VQPLIHFYSILRGSHSVLPGLNFQPPFPASLLIDMEVCSNIWNYASTITVQVQHLAFSTLRKNCCATISTHNLSTLFDVATIQFYNLAFQPSSSKCYWWFRGSVMHCQWLRVFSSVGTRENSGSSVFVFEELVLPPLTECSAPCPDSLWMGEGIFTTGEIKACNKSSYNSWMCSAHSHPPKINQG
jgi:hypothetical protein